MPTIAFYTLGCRSNQFETGQMLRQAAAAGFEVVDFNDTADIYVINTCTVTSAADKKSRQSWRKSKIKNPKSKVIVTGCYVNLEGKELSETENIDLIIKDKSKLIEDIKTLVPRPTSHVPHPSSHVRIRENLLIQTGCEQFCSYCIVPYARGPVKSKPLTQILSEARKLVKLGAREIVLTGINLGAYGKEFKLPTPNYQLPNIINKLSEIDKLLRIRLSSIEPMYLTDELIECVAENPKVCHHLHIPLQNGDNKILGLMERPYRREDFLALTQKIRNKIPDIGLTTDVIVGFPGEGDTEFKNTLDLAEQIKFSRIHVFHYSERKGTKAVNLPHKVDPKTMQIRAKKLNTLRDKLMQEFAGQYLGKEVEVLVESPGEGLTSNYIRCKFKGSSVGTLRKIKLVEVKRDYCLGTI